MSDNDRAAAYEYAARTLRGLATPWLAWYEGDRVDPEPDFPASRMAILAHLRQVCLILDQNTQLEQERDEDVRAVGRLLDLVETDPALNYGPVVVALRARFAQRIADLAARAEREAPGCDHGPGYQCVSCTPDDGSFSFEPLGGAR